MNKKILIVDDEKNIVDALESYLKSLGYQIITADNGKSGLAAFAEGNPDLVILDLMMPQLSGEEVCKRIRQVSRVPIIMLTAKVQEGEIVDGLRMGADDYITKPFRLKELGARIEAVLRRITPEESLRGDKKGDRISGADGLVIDLLSHRVWKGQSEINLTPHEFKILSTLAKHGTKVFTREELISLVMGEDYQGFDRAVDSHIKNIRLKLEEDIKNPKYIITVHGVGYRFGELGS